MPARSHDAPESASGNPDPAAGDDVRPSRLLRPEMLQPGETVQIAVKPALAMVLVVSYRTLFWGILLVICNEHLQPDRFLFHAW